MGWSLYGEIFCVGEIEAQLCGKLAKGATTFWASGMFINSQPYGASDTCMGKLEVVILISQLPMSASISQTLLQTSVIARSLHE